MFKIDLEKILNWISERWHSRYSIIILIVILFFLFINLFTGIEYSKIRLFDWSVLGLIIISTFLIWLYTTKVPKTHKNKIGFIVAIFTENKEQYKKLKSDFIETLQENISTGNIRNQFDLIVYHEYYSRKIKDHEIASIFLNKSNAHFMIYGRGRVRNLKGENHFVLNLEGIVSHKPIPVEVSTKFSKEFGELLPRRLAIAEENDLFSFDVVANWIKLVSQYIVGIASLLSGDLEHSKNLFYSVLNDLKNLRSNFPALVKINQRIPNRITETVYLMARNEYEIYNKVKSETHLIKMGNYLSEIKNIAYNHYPSNLLRAIYHFLNDRNIKAAFNELKKCKDIRDGAWRYSYAFLKAYEGNLKVAAKCYKNAFKYDCAVVVPLEVEEFIVDILGQEPEKYQLYFCLGMINFIGKSDYPAAKRDFELFLNNGNPKDFKEQRTLVKNYLLQINTKISD